MLRLLLMAILIGLVTWFETTLYGTHILRFYSWELSVWDRILVVWSLVAKTLLLVLPPMAIGCWLQRNNRPRLASVGMVLVPVGVLAWFTLDVKIQAMTGQHASYYAARLFNRNAQKMMGSGQLVLPVFAPLIFAAIGLGVVALVYRKTKALWQKQSVDTGAVTTSPASERFVPWLLGLGAIVVITLLLVRQSVDQPAVLERLYASLPANTVLFHPDSVSDHGASTFGDNVDSLFTPLGARFLEISLAGSTPSFQRVPTADELTADELTADKLTADKLTADEAMQPNVIVVVLESFRFESISPGRMPRLHAWSQPGMVAENHYSGSNCSPQGGFALLFGQLAMCMDSVLNTNADASLCQMARTSGYETRLYASCDFFYRRMSEFFAEPDFDSVQLFRYERNRWPEADTESIETLREGIETATTPQLAVAFLMSTHYDYQYPIELESMDVESLVDQAMLKDAEQATQRVSRTRYQKSLAFMDQMLGDFVESLDMDQNIVVITGDHGESMWEDGTIAHGSRLSEIQSRVPMIIFGAGIEQARLTTPTSHTDLLPTLASRLGVTTTGPGQHGIDWLNGLPSGPRLLVHEYPDTWDVALIDETLATDGEKLLINIDRRTGATRVLGFVGDEGIVEVQRKKNPAAAKQWASSFQAALDRIAP